MTSWFRRYPLPGFVFQSIIIAGGYGTGRELVEFFLRFGPLGGLLGMLLPSMLLVSLTSMASFEFVRVFETYDYRTFFQRLLGRGWFAYEIGYLSAVLLILAVIGSAAGAFLLETFGLPHWVGVVGLLLTIGFLVFKGTGTIERFFSGWSFLLYGVYIVFFAWSISRFGGSIGAALASGEVREGWALSGFRYGVLQLSLIPAMLFATRHIRRRREALWAGALTGPIAMIPAILFFVAMSGQYPGILDRPRAGQPSARTARLKRVPDRVSGRTPRHAHRVGDRLDPRLQRTDRRRVRGAESPHAGGGAADGGRHPPAPRLRPLQIRDHRPHRHGLRRPELGLPLHLRPPPAHARDVPTAQAAHVGRDRVGRPILKG
ncbi:hypothetical protein [Candidatus Palauibacter sp.]|uniref:hypothetical protein n=1 Tax=Candidatus Palauibacter sp. TaxID=3101350 RepID=UPI003C6EF4F8